VFGDKDVFLSILNPLYFINVLGDSGKNLLEKLLPAVKHKDVLLSLPEESQAILAEQSLSSPETFIKNRRSELKKLEDTLIGYYSQKELLDHQRKERIDKTSELKAAVDKISDDIAELVSLRDNDRDTAAEELALEEIRKRRAELLSEAANTGTNKAMREVMEKIKNTEISMTKLADKRYTSAYSEQMASIESELKMLYSEHDRLNTALSNTVVGYKCPICAAVVTEENIAAVRADLEQRLSVTITDGKAAKSTLADITAQDNTAKLEFEKQKAEMLEAENAKLDELNQRLQELNIAYEFDKDDYGEKLAALELEISGQENRLANGNWSPEQTSQFAGLTETKKEYESQIKALSNVPDYDYTKQIAEMEADISKLKRLITEVIQYMAKRIELMLEGLKMSNTEIVLTEIVKTTGEVKDCFRFSYDGRDYKCLSLSEKIRVGLDMATLIQRLSGRSYPIFVDNGESICTFGKVDLSGQVIIARVVNNQALQVTHRKRESPKPKAAA
jgi:DNA repair exonuclease SbcCD ATPase subunit